MPRALGLLSLAALVFIGGCPRRGPDRPSALQFGPHRAVKLHDSELTGVSGLAVSGGDLLVVTESSHRFLRLESDSEGTYRVAAEKPVSGVAKRRDLESLARLGPGQYAFGTEVKDPKKVARIYFATETESTVTSTHSVKLKVKKLFGMRAKDNQGIEGLCASDGYLVAAIETVRETEDGRRLAPIAVMAPGARGFAPAWVHLLTETGKLSSIHCRRVDDALEVIAIERHYGVMRVIGFRVPLAPQGEVLEATMLVDLQSVYEALGEPNFEGIERLDDGTLVLVSDNDHGGRDGPTVLLFVSKSAYTAVSR